MAAKGRVGNMPHQMLPCKTIPATATATNHLDYTTPHIIASSIPSSSSFSCSQENMSPKSVILNSSSRLLMAYSNPSSSSFSSNSSGKMAIGAGAAVEADQEEASADDSKTDNMVCLRDLMIASDLQECRPTVLLSVAVAETGTESSSSPSLYPMQEKCEDNWSWMSCCEKKEGPTNLTTAIIAKIDIPNPNSEEEMISNGLGQLHLTHCKAEIINSELHKSNSSVVSSNNDLKAEYEYPMSLLDRSPTIQAASARWGDPEDHSATTQAGFMTEIQYQGLKKSLADPYFSTPAYEYPAWDLYPSKPAHLAVPERDENEKLVFCVRSPTRCSHYPLAKHSSTESFLPCDHHTCRTRMQAPKLDQATFALQWPDDYVDVSLQAASSLVSRDPIVLPQLEQESLITGGGAGGKSWLRPLAQKVGANISALESGHSVQCNLIDRINRHGGRIDEGAQPRLADIATQKLNSTAKCSMDHRETKPMYSPTKTQFLVGDSKLGSGMAIMMDAATEITPCVSCREMGTQITPLASANVSRATTPIKCTSPSPRYTTPTLYEGGVTTCISNPIVGLHFGESESYYCSNMPNDLYNNLDRTIPLAINENGVGEVQEQSLERSISVWSSRDEEEEEVGRSLRHFDLDDLRKGFVEARACAWLEAERAKCQARYARQEAKIEDWEKQEMAKTEAEENKFEELLWKMRSRMNEKAMKKKAATHRKAKEMRAFAQAEQMQEEAKVAKRADRIRRTGHFPSHFSPYACFF